MILDVLPADVAPRLDKLPKSVNKKLINSLLKHHFGRWISIAGVVIIAGIAVAIWGPWQSEPVRLPTSVTSEITSFVPYYFSKNSAKGLTVVEDQMNYSGDVLFFQVKDTEGKNAVAVSEQALPNNFSKITPQGDQSVANVDGAGVISIREGRTIGTLITNKKPKALISLNAPDSVSANQIAKIMQALAPINSK